MTTTTGNQDPRLTRAAKIAFVALWLLLPAAALYKHHIDAEFLTLTLIAIVFAVLSWMLIRTMFKDATIFSGSALFLPLGGIALKYVGISNVLALQVGWFAAVMLPLWFYRYYVSQHPLSTEPGRSS